jgi:hypothetical protein
MDRSSGPRRIILGVVLIVSGCTGRAARYTLIEERDDSDREVFYVRIPQKLTVEELQTLCINVKARHGGKRPRTVIWFSLPGRRCPEDAWALGEFQPPLSVKIRGLPIDKEKDFLAHALPPHGELVGDWLDDRQGGARYVIHRTNGVLFLSGMPLDGATWHAQELIEQPSSGGERKFVRKARPRVEEVCLVRADGKFEIRDERGIRVIGEPVIAGER